MDNPRFAKRLLILLFALSSVSVQSQPSISLEPIGQVVIPYNQMFKGTPIGGLSGLAYDSGSNIYYVISDDRSDLAVARFYSFTVALNEAGKLEEGGISFQSMQYLQMSDGQAYPKGRVDPEGIAFGNDSLIYISSEGVPEKQVTPFINAYKTSGEFIKSYAVPEAYWATDKSARSRHGVRRNLGFEGLAISPDGSKLYAATENALLQDGPAAGAKQGSPSRLIVYDVASGNVLYEYSYMVEQVYAKSSLLNAFAVNGLTDLLALDDGSLLTIERNYVAGQGNKITLYAINLEDATDIKGVSGMKELAEPPQPVEKQLVADLNDFNITIDNFEGLVLGPELDGGGRLLLMVSDNNFSRSQQTIFTAFRVAYR